MANLHCKNDRSCSQPQSRHSAATLPPMKRMDYIVAVALFVAASCAHSQWKWVDAQGRSVYSDLAPPPDVPEVRILKRPGGTPANPDADASAQTQSTGATPATGATPNAAQPRGVDAALEARKKQAALADAARQKAEQEKASKARADNCKRARSAKATLEAGGRLAQINTAGEPVVMDDATRAAEIRHAQSVMDADCNTK